MSERDFLGEASKARCKAAVEAVEARTAAELLVAVRPWSGFYGHADYLAGAGAAFVVLLALLFLPQPFEIVTMPFEVAGAFALGAFLASRSPRVRRVLTSPAHRRDRVAAAARAAFVDLGVSRTRGRTGVLVFVSLLERDVEVVADVGVDLARLEARWEAALVELRDAVRDRADVDRFVRALEALGPLFSEILPRSADDVNELPDEVRP